MGLFSRKPKVDPEEVAALRGDLIEVRTRLLASEQARQALELRLHNLDIGMTAAMTDRDHFLNDMTMRMAEMDVLKRQVAQLDVVNARIASLDGLQGRIAELNDRISVTSNDAQEAKQQAAVLNERFASVSTEIANQLSELGKELDELALRQAEVAATNGEPPEPPVAPQQPISDEVIAQLRTAQSRLAAEQARYEIAFRQDLAMLADQVHRHRGR